MKKLLFILSLSPLFALGQTNLVPNPSFEIYFPCPAGINSGSPDEVAKATGWASTLGTPDYFNTCAPSSSVGVPNNQLGAQNAATGNAYCGFIIYGGGFNYREIISSQLSTTLSIGQKYYVSIQVSFAGNPIYWGVASDKIGVKFSTVQYSIASPPPINNSAHVYTNTVIADSINWVVIQNSFIADSSYQYINVGNFFDDANTDTIHMSPSGNNYYYVDDICVSTDSTLCMILGGISEEINSFLLIYPNPVNQLLIINNFAIVDQSVTLANALGETMLKVDVKKKTELKIDCTNFSSGIYFLITKYNSLKFIIQH